MKLRQIALVCFALTLGYLGFGADSVESKTPEQRVIVTFERFITENGWQGAEFMASNCTARAVWFWGYSPENPVYKVELAKNGAWEDSRLGWCGVGMDRRRLAGHRIVKFTVPVKNDALEARAIRVGLTCSPRKQVKKVVEKTYWSEKVELQN